MILPTFYKGKRGPWKLKKIIGGGQFDNVHLSVFNLKLKLMFTHSSISEFSSILS